MVSGSTLGGANRRCILAPFRVFLVARMVTMSTRHRVYPIELPGAVDRGRDAVVRVRDRLEDVPRHPGSKAGVSHRRTGLGPDRGVAMGVTRVHPWGLGRWAFLPVIYRTPM